MPAKRYPPKYPADRTVVLCGLNMSVTAGQVKTFLESRNAMSLIEDSSQPLLDKKTNDKKIMYLNVGSSQAASELIAKLNDVKSEEIGSMSTQYYLQAVIKSKLNNVTWSKYIENKTLEGTVSEKQNALCRVQCPEVFVISREVLCDNWSDIRIGDTVRIDLRQNYETKKWDVVGAVKIKDPNPAPSPDPAQPSCSDTSTCAKSGPADLRDSADMESRARSYRIQRLLLEVSPKVLSQVFKQAWQNTNRQPWTEALGPSLLQQVKQNADVAKALGPKGLKKIGDGVVESWDITALAKLLLEQPGLLSRSSPQSRAVQALRAERNEFVHNLQSSSKLCQADFDQKWRAITQVLEQLMAGFGIDERRQYTDELKAILNEGVDIVREEQFAGELEEMKANLQDVMANVDALQGEQAKMKEALANAATRTEVDRRIQAGVKEGVQVALQQLQLDTQKDRLQITTSSGVRYEVRLDKKLGNGAMGSVYEARDLRDGQLAAVKICDDAGSSRGDREALNLESIVHDNVVRFLGSYRGKETGGRLAIAMELVVGESYQAYLASHGPLVWKRGARDMAQLLSGLAAVHALGIAHRDVKPDNIMRKRDGRLVLVDFGLSKAMQSPGATVTMAGAAIGSPAYMSPEAVRGDVSAVGAASDVFSAGVVFYETLTGLLPFPCDKPGGSGSSIRSSSSKMDGIKVSRYLTAMADGVAPVAMGANGEVDPDHPVPPALEHLISRRALAADLATRFADAGEMLAALEEFLENPGRAVGAGDASPSPPPDEALSLSASGAAFWAQVAAASAEEDGGGGVGTDGGSGDDASVAWAVFAAFLDSNYPGLGEEGLWKVQDEVDEDRNGEVSLSELRAWLKGRELDDAVGRIVARLPRGGNGCAGATTTAAGNGEPANVFYSRHKVQRITYEATRLMFGKKQKAGTLALHHGALVLTRADGGKEKDRFDLVAGRVAIRSSASQPRVLEIFCGGTKAATYTFETAEQASDWQDAIASTQAWLMSSS